MLVKDDCTQAVTDAMLSEKGQRADIPGPLDHGISEGGQATEARYPGADFGFFRGLLTALALSALIYGLLYFFLW